MIANYLRPSTFLKTSYQTEPVCPRSAVKDRKISEKLCMFKLAVFKVLYVCWASGLTHLDVPPDAHPDASGQNHFVSLVRHHVKCQLALTNWIQNCITKSCPPQFLLARQVTWWCQGAKIILVGFKLTPHSCGHSLTPHFSFWLYLRGFFDEGMK